MMDDLENICMHAALPVRRERLPIVFTPWSVLTEATLVTAAETHQTTLIFEDRQE